MRENKDDKDKFDCEWKEGVWLGHARATNETIIGTADGAIRAYAIKRMTEDDRWLRPRGDYPRDTSGATASRS